jgi:thiol-disulfide isomerase/thioredoxin
MRITILLLLVLFTFQFGFSQNQDEIKVLTFNEFKKNYLSSTSDTTYVINFWATWCVPCIKEIPAFERINKEYNDKTLKVVLVSLDFPNRIENSLKPFLKRHSVSSEVILLNAPNYNNWIDKISPEWSGSIPATYVYKNRKSNFFEKSFTYDELKNIINSKNFMP